MLDWQKRLAELLIAGGSLMVAGCSHGPSFACNANPDPCCSEPNSQACQVWNGCLDAGGHWDYEIVDGGLAVRECLLPDAGTGD
jgi:hypothetical protein